MNNNMGMFETKKCKHCFEDINAAATRCPKCGGSQGIPAYAIVLIIIGVLILIGAGLIITLVAKTTINIQNGENNIQNKIAEQAKEYRDINGKTRFKINETFQNQYEKVTVKSINKDYKSSNELIKPKDGNKFIAIEIEMENINSNEYSTGLFNAYYNNVALDKDYDFNLENFFSPNGRNKKSTGYLLYQAPKDANDITLEFSNFTIYEDLTIYFDL